MQKNVDAYFTEGCGRCKLGNTPDCKVVKWQQILLKLRKLLEDTELKETCKWGSPVYTLNKKNVLQIVAFKEFAGLSFFKGTLIKDEHKLLSSPGSNSHHVRFAKFTTIETLLEKENLLMAYVKEAIAIEKKGLKVEKPTITETIPEELLAKFQQQPVLEKAFYNLTPGRQRGYLIYFTGAKQSATRENRIEKYTAHILSGKGFHDK
ncbi:Uncharacterized conserved protein YdeI, YjbR/CyaY-like superfamily, DUF1801 family [Pustulibacterium marinum]|uniref:Uncharacterized conserved protein YdeI, YjbR/CyaY-like superfamily, DUF1801 family n=1 Tax=Pustulibacterium marinum TaxID=1224947 RepID=A0A1I7GVK7_9FLAO|nr:YdeI/OmpD-associated family protein [Pustulibacterium marinum]SFU52473.1 Uncharacterized conserved protein YdeI, YjbR/CyaY-like superfamily, DUF1801 family [Pustulibacterium marinum]